MLAIDPADAPRFRQFEADMRAEMKPEGALENEAFQQFIDAAARLDKIRTLLGSIYQQHAEEPLCVPDAAAQIRQLSRYRAAAEMLLYRALGTLRELQTTRLFREFHVTPQEQEVIPPMVNPGTKILCDGQMYGHNDRELFYHLFGADKFTSRLPKLPENGFADSNPIAA